MTQYPYDLTLVVFSFLQMQVAPGRSGSGMKSGISLSLRNTVDGKMGRAYWLSSVWKADLTPGSW